VEVVRTRDWAAVDFYAVLGVPATATGEEINVAFRALAKRLHPDRVGAAAAESERFKTVTAAYEVLGDDRLRRSYDQVRLEAGPATRAAIAANVARTAAADSASGLGSPLPPEKIRRAARRWIAAGVAVSLAGVLAAGLVAHLQVDEHARRAGRVKADAVLVVRATGNEIRFTTSVGTVQVAEPARVNPGAERDGESLTILYRRDRPSDVIIDESTVARDITLWIVAVKLLVGGAIFVIVGIRRLRQYRVSVRAP
jgi:DnaJ domain